MLETANEMYRYFLDEVRKERTVVVTPEQWTRMINPVILDWVKTKLPEADFNQKRIDDLEVLKIYTDGTRYPFVKVIFSEKNTFLIPYNNEDLPTYLYGISVAFINAAPGDESEGDTGVGDIGLSFIDEAEGENPPPVLKKGEIIPAKLLRSDFRATNRFNPYRQPNDKTYVFFEQRDNRIYAITKEDDYDAMILEYYRYPEQVIYDGKTDNPGEFMPIQKKEFLDMAVTRYLERVMDQRIQSQPSVVGVVPK